MDQTCSRCGIAKSASEFYVRKDRPLGRTSICRGCKAEYNRSWYERNRDKHRRDVVANTKRYRETARRLIREAKARPCMDCGITYPAHVMDFDHVRGSKLGNLAKLVSVKTNLDILREEIAKCEVVCANCHRMRTFGG